MRRLLTGLAAWLLIVAPTARAQTPAELAKTAEYVAAFQNADGGFTTKAGGDSSLGATSSAIRILKYTGGSIPDVLAAIKYVRSCFNPEQGGFAQTPGGKPDVATTSSGLMALNELKLDKKGTDADLFTKSLKFLSENAKSYEEVRIAVAGFEAAGETSKDVFERWSADILKTQNSDGTFGSGDTKAFETGGKAVALLRMGQTLEKKDAIVAFLKSTQRPDGAWSQGEKGSELNTTYRIMRFFYMVKESPNLATLGAFVANCRHSEGGYGAQPGAEATPGSTYLGTINARWARLLNGEPALVETAGFVPLFNGKDLNGWEGDASLWAAKEGLLVGRSSGLKHNDFLATDQSYGSFVLKLTFQLVSGEGNSGVQFRSVRVPDHEMSGFQADIGQDYWGCLYDESRRNRVLAPASDASKKALHKETWNQYVIDAKGDDIRLALNGPTSVTYHEDDSSIARAGRIALQMHAGGPIEVRFKDIYIQPVPEPKEDTEVSPGFHLRMLKFGEDSRKYTLYIPKGYDGSKAFPVVLFLHGSGERGKDGVKSAQVGLGPAILNNIESFPAIAVIPQARQTWNAGSDDAKAALAALDEVIASLNVDTKKVAITGLSMGGRGAWEIAAENPSRFSAVVPVCGMGKTESAAALAALPVWAFVGDADSVRTVTNTRAMVEAVRTSGGSAKLTEYRDVGHNSWDRAYNNTALVDWLLAQTRK